MGKRKKSEPSEFQKEILEMTYEEFIAETNIKDLHKSFYNEKYLNKTMTEDHEKQGLDCFYNLRVETNKWHKSILKNLKYKVCDCKRKKIFHEKSFQVSAEKIPVSCQTDQAVQEDVRKDLLPPTGDVEQEAAAESEPVFASPAVVDVQISDLQLSITNATAATHDPLMVRQSNKPISDEENIDLFARTQPQTQTQIG